MDPWELAGEKRGNGRLRRRHGGEEMGEYRAPFHERVQVRRGRQRIAQPGQMIRPEAVNNEKDKILHLKIVSPQSLQHLSHLDKKMANTI